MDGFQKAIVATAVVCVMLALVAAAPVIAFLLVLVSALTE